MKDEYSNQLELVRRSIRNRDPMGLLSHGAPADEYDFEAQQILALVPKCTSVESLKQGIHRIFAESFGQEEACTPDAFATLAQEIYESLRADG